MNKEIPISVLDAAQGLISQYGQNVVFSGEYMGIEYYTFKFPEESVTGYPVVYMYNINTKEVINISGSRALDIIGELMNN